MVKAGSNKKQRLKPFKVIPYLLKKMSWWMASTCKWEIAVWTGGLKAYVHVPDAARARGSICSFLVFGLIPHGPQLSESISTPGVFQQHRSCSTSYNTAFAGMH